MNTYYTDLSKQFDANLYEAGLGEQIEGMVKELYAGNGAVRQTLHKYVAAR